MSTSQPSLSHLFAPLRIGSMQVRNRILSTAHLTNYADNGLPTQQHLRYWESKARGGIGLIITEGSLVHPSSRVPGTRFIELWNDACIEPLASIADAVHRHGARIVAQINHMGAAWSPSGRARANGARPHTMTGAEITDVVRAFAGAARRVQSAGLDGVEIHATHGYLIEQFLSPLTNRRADSYGGSEQNRMRLLHQVLDAVRDEVGRDFVVGIRANGDEFVPGGLDHQDMRRIVGAVVDRGRNAAGGCVDFVNVSYYRSSKFGPTGTSIVPMYVPEGQYVYLAAGIKQVVDVPVFCVNRIVDPMMAEQILAAGDADMVGMTRANIADPELPEKARTGRLDQIRPCIGINEGCIGQVMAGAGQPMTCAVNPGVGHEADPDAARPSSAKKVVVVGGGISGMEVARLAAERGHGVVLFEAGDALGGQLRLAARAPGLAGMARPVGYFQRQFQLLNVDVRLHTTATRRVIDQERPDAVVVATGGTGASWADTDLPEPPTPMGRATARQVLSGERPVGARVVIVATDQGLEPIATAEFCAEQGAAVTMVVPYHVVGGDLETQVRNLALHRIQDAGVRVLAATSVRGYDAAARAVLIGPALADGHVEGLPDIDTVVLGAGTVADERLFDELDGEFAELHRIGDCLAPRRIVAATQDAYRVGSTI